MIFTSIIVLLLSNAVNIRRDISILCNRIAMIILVYSILNDLSSLTVITKGLGLHGGLLLITNITQIFHIFLYLINILILTLTSFYPRKVWVSEYSSIKSLLLYKFVYYNTKIINKMGEHIKIVEYPVGRCGYSSMWEKLSNSGDALKLQVSSYSGKTISGWSNHSCMVTNQKISEKNVGYRGSKSAILSSVENVVVKEQRVNGSWHGYGETSLIKITLKGLFLNYRVRNLTKVNPIIP